MELNEISGAVVSAAIKIHSALGPGLMESVYEKCLIHELTKRGLKVASQIALPVVYDGVKIDAGYRIDMMVEDEVVVELKATAEGITDLHKAQLLTYLKLSGKKLGLIINFNVVHMKFGIKRMVNGELPQVLTTGDTGDTEVHSARTGLNHRGHGDTEAESHSRLQ